MYRRRRTLCRHRCGAPACGQRHPFRPLFRLTGSDPHCAGRRPVRLGHGLLAGAGIRGRGASVGGCRPLSGGRSGRGHCDGAEQGHCLRRSGGPVLPVAAPTVSETFHSAVGSGRPAGQYGGWFCWAADCFSCPSSISGRSRRAMPAPELSDGGHGGLSLHTGDHRWLGPLRGAPVPPGAVYDEDLLLRSLWKRCTANCPSADKP